MDTEKGNMTIQELSSLCKQSECEDCINFEHCEKYIDAVEHMNRKYNHKIKLSTIPEDFFEAVHALYSLATELY